MAKGGRHHASIARLILGQHRQQAKLGGAFGSDELLQAWRRPRYDQRALVERQDLAKGIIAAHRDDASCTGHQTFEPGVKGDGPHVVELGRPAGENRSLFRQHKRAENEQGRVRNTAIVLVGRQHQVDQSLAIPSAAWRDQQKIVENAYDLRCELQLAGGAPQIPGISHPLVDGCGHPKAGERVADLGQTIDPDLVVIFLQGRNHLLALPLALERLRIIHHVAQPQDQGGSAPLQQIEGITHFAAQSQGLLVDDQQVRIEDVRRVANYRRAHRQRLVNINVQIERDVFAVSELDDARHAHKVDARTEIEAADDRRPGEDQNQDRGVGIDQRVCYRPTPPQVAESEAVVAVDKHPSVLTANGHTGLSHIVDRATIA